MTIIVTTEQFKQMSSYQIYTENNTKHQQVKLSLINDIKNAYGDKWTRLKEGTRKAIDYLSWFAAERGFAFPSCQHVGEKYSISDRTVRNVTKKLEQEGLIVKVYRRAKKTNSKGKPIFIFTNHPYFSYWVELLKLEFHTDFHKENAQKPYSSKSEDRKKVSTDNLPYYYKLNNKRNINVNDLDDSFTPSHVPKAFVRMVKPFLKSAYKIYTLWGRVIIAYKNSSLEKPLDSLISLIIKAFKEAIFSKKAGRIKGDFNGYFYGTLHRMFVVERRNEVTYQQFNWLENTYK